MSTQILLQLAVSLGLGLLVGLQREWRARALAGIRSFTLVTLLGTLCGLLVEAVGPWVVPVGLLAVAALLVAENRARAELGDEHPGPTTELAALVMFLVGAAVVVLSVELAVVLGGGVALLLHGKAPLHGFARRIDEREIRGIMRLVLIGLVILPVLPDRAFGPFDVLNPFRVWLMVVLIAGISVAGYLAHGLMGARVGTLLAGVLGGLISSTATTVAYARRTRRGTAGDGGAALVVLVASLVVFGRVLFEVFVVAPDVLPRLAPPLLAMTGWMGLVTLGCLALRPAAGEAVGRPEDPSNLGTAVLFGLLYAVVLLAVAVAQRHFGDSGLYVVSVLSGLTDMDAITLSTAELMRGGELPADTGWRMILVGALSNLLFKGLVVASLGSARLARFVGLLFALALAGGGLILWLWPAGGSATAGA